MPHVFTKYFFLPALVSLLLLSGLGCKGQSAEQAAAIRPRALEMWTIFDDLDALDPIIKKYRIERPYLTVNVRQYRPEEFYVKLVEALAEDKGPDIITVRNRSMREYLTKLSAMPASVKDATIRLKKGTIKDETVIAVTPRATATVDQLDKEFVPAVKKDVVQGGKIYGLPLSFDTMVVYYNKDLLNKAGIAEPPKDWTEFQVAVKKLTKLDKAGGKIVQAGAAIGAGNNIPGVDDLLYLLFKQSKVAFVDSAGRAAFQAQYSGGSDGASSVATVMNFFTDFANPTRDTYTWSEQMEPALESFNHGTAAFFFGFQYHHPLIKARAPQLNFGVLPMFQLDSGSPVNAANYSVLSVTGMSKNVNEAWAFIDYLTRTAATKEYLDKSGKLTARRMYIQAQTNNPELAPFVAQILVAENWYKGKNYDAAYRAVSDMLREWLQASATEQFLQAQRDILNRAAAKINQTL